MSSAGTPPRRLQRDYAGPHTRTATHSTRPYPRDSPTRIRDLPEIQAQSGGDAQRGSVPDRQELERRIAALLSREHHKPIRQLIN